MKTIYDIQQLLKRFGIFIYTGNRLADLEIMEEEIQELFHLNVVDVNDYKLALLILKKEQRSEIDKEGRTI